MRYFCKNINTESMARHLLLYALIALTGMLLPVQADAMPAETLMPEMQQNDSPTVAVSVKNRRTLYVTGASDQTLEVVSLTGKPVASVKIDSPAQRIELNNLPKGCYVVKVGKVVRKISVG